MGVESQVSLGEIFNLWSTAALSVAWERRAFAELTVIKQTVQKIQVPLLLSPLKARRRGVENPQLRVYH